MSKGHQRHVSQLHSVTLKLAHPVSLRGVRGEQNTRGEGAATEIWPTLQGDMLRRGGASSTSNATLTSGLLALMQPVTGLSPHQPLAVSA
jgi:hypothetical protein